MNRKTRYIAVAAVLSFMLHSCIDDRYLAECPDDIALRGGLMLNLQLTMQAPQTRAEGHPLEEALDPEDYIDLDGRDYRILIFDGRGRFIQNFGVTQQRLSATDDKNRYTVALSGPLAVSRGEIQVMVLTNWRGFDSAADYPNLTAGDRAERLYTDDSDNIFTMPTAGTAGRALTGWQPEVPGSGIPMFGVSEVVPISAATDPADDDTIDGKRVDGKVLDIGVIKMLRAVAKIEVMFTGSDESLNGVAISDVSLSAFNTTGRFIPDITANPSWNTETAQVATPTLPDGVVRSAQPLKFFRAADSGTWRAYVPEISLTADRPTMDITVSTTGSAIAASRTFTIALDNPLDPGTLQHLLRNHIYRYKISSVEMFTDLEIYVDVDPWDEGDLNPEHGLGDKDGTTDNDPWDEGDQNPEHGSGNKDGTTDNDPWDEGDQNPEHGSGDKDGTTDNDPWDEGEQNPDHGLGDKDGTTDNDPWDEGEQNPEHGSGDKDGTTDNDPWDEGEQNPDHGLGDKDGTTDNDPWDEGEQNPNHGLGDKDGTTDNDPWDEGEQNPNHGLGDKDGTTDNDPWDEGDQNPNHGLGDKDGTTDNDPWDEGEQNPNHGLGDKDGTTDNDPWDEGEQNPNHGLGDKDGVTDSDPWDESDQNPQFGLRKDEDKAGAKTHKTETKKTIKNK